MAWLLDSAVFSLLYNHKTHFCINMNFVVKKTSTQAISITLIFPLIIKNLPCMFDYKYMLYSELIQLGGFYVAESPFDCS